MRFLNADASYWAPAAVTPTLMGYRGMRSMRVIARLKPDVTREQAQAQTAARMQQIARDVPDEADDLGVRAGRMLTLRTPLPRLRYGDHAQRTLFFQQALERVRLIPGVTAATYVSQLPLAGRGGGYPIDIEGRIGQPTASAWSTPSGSPPEAGHRQIGPDYFRTLGISITQGRDFNDRDTLLTQPVAINETMARRYWPNESPARRAARVDPLIALRHD